MATPTYDLLDSTTLSSSASSVTFSSIDQSYRDLVLVVSLIGTADDFAYLQFNSDSGTNYSRVIMFGNGSSAGSTSSTGETAFGFEQRMGTTPILALTQIMDYSATDKHKSAIARMNKVDNRVHAVAQRYASTSAITQLDITTATNGFAAGSTFYLYGIAS